MPKCQINSRQPPTPRKSKRSRFGQDTETVSPSPGVEGRGEGGCCFKLPGKRFYRRRRTRTAIHQGRRHLSSELVATAHGAMRFHRLGTVFKIVRRLARPV